MEENKNKGRKPLIIAIIIVAVLAIAYFAYRQIYNMLFGGNIAVSMDDVYSTINACKVPIIFIVAGIIAAIVVSIAVSKKEKALRTMIRWQSLFACVLVIVVAVNAICLNIEYSLINKTLSGTKVLLEETAAASKALVEDIADEGIVMLKNDDNSLPISTDTKLNIFGWGSTQPIYGGTGSGNVSEDTAVSLIQGIENAGFETNTELTDFYTNYRSDRPEIGMGGVDWTSPQPTMEEYDEAGIFEQAKEYSDTAVVVLTRSGGEGPDLPEKMSTDNTYNKTQMGDDIVYTTNEEDAGSDVSYLEITKREREMVEHVNEKFENVIVIINSANSMELGWLEEYDNINAALWVAGAGETGFNAVGNILSGETNPSGKLVDTYVYDLTATPTYNNFGSYQYTNSSDVTGAEESVASFVNYVEGIYVGYKYYETAAAEGQIDYDATVQYPFGYGLSYTTFEKEITNFTDDGNEITAEVTVTNAGDTAGKEVVELYYTPPYYNGGIEKASTNLVGYEKTGVIEPGESEVVTVTFSYEDMASFDEKTNQCYVLENGDYEITLNSDSHTVLDSKTISLQDDIIYNDENDGIRSTDDTIAANAFDNASGDVKYLSRADHFANYDEVTAAPTDFEMTEEEKATYSSKATYNKADYDSEDAEMPTTGADNGLTLQDMAGLDYDDVKWDDLLDQMTVEEMTNMVQDGGFKIAAADSIGSADATACDGPAGITSNFTGSTGTGFPPATLIAATWNKELAYERGTQIGTECNELGVSGWYGPAMNTHRSAFAGRNFEYYSEDSTISYFAGLNEVKGATEQGVICYVKHFALNDQETNRTSGICTYATEQSIREIYLKAFEGAVKEGGSLGIMSSFNSIGTQWAGANESLLKTVLRDEWGFHGAVITDAMDPLADFYMDLNRGIRTGLTQGLSMANGGAGLITDTEDAGTAVALREATHENLYAAANSNAMDNDTGMPNWVKVFVGADVLVALLLAGCEVLVIRGYKKKINKVKIEVSDK